MLDFVKVKVEPTNVVVKRFRGICEDVLLQLAEEASALTFFFDVSHLVHFLQEHVDVHALVNIQEKCNSLVHGQH